MATQNPTTVAGLDWERTARAFLHPTQIAILEILDGGRCLSPSEMRFELQERRLGQIAYHFTVLARAGLLVRVASAKRRGAVENFYMIDNERKEG